MSILGVDLGGTNIRAGFVKNNKLLGVESLQVRKAGTEKEILNDLIELIAKFSSENIEGIGIGVPGIVDVEKGIVFDLQNIPSWKEVHLKDILQKEFNLPVYVNNDANCFAVGEKYFGKAKQHKNIVGLIIGTGLGAGIIINNQLYSGHNCGAGEFGNIPFKDKSYEYYCSGQFFTNEFGLSGKELSLKAADNEINAIEIFRNYGSNLGEAIKLIMYAVDPEVIVLGGSVSKSFRFFKDEMWESINKFDYQNSIDRIKIEVSEKENIAILGAAALYLNAQ